MAGVASTSRAGIMRCGVVSIPDVGEDAGSTIHPAKFRVSNDPVDFLPQLLPIVKSIRAAEVAVNNWYDGEKLAA